MKPAVRNGATLLILLLAVFPCGAALTVLGTIVIKLLRALSTGSAAWTAIRVLIIPILRCIAGVIGFLSIIPSVDKLMVAERRLGKREIFGMVLGILCATQFLVTYLLHLSALKLFRLICIGPVAIEVLLLVYHLARCGGRPPRTPEDPDAPMGGGFSSSMQEDDKTLAS